MRTFSKISYISVIAIAFAPAAASAQQGLLDSLPKIRVGNGAPITGSNSSQLGIGVLTPEVRADFDRYESAGIPYDSVL
jgi:hypothetical protein